jgi:hypothetical protein
MKYTFNDLFNDISFLYQAVNEQPFDKVVLPKEFKEFGDLMEQVFEQKFISYKDVDPYGYKQSNKVGVAFSGGKDSTALAVHLKDAGCKVVLYHFTGVNKAYPDERKYAANFAAKYGFDFRVVKVGVPVSKGTYAENVVKNNLIMAQILADGMFTGIVNTGLGCAYMSRDILPNYGFSDSNQNLASFGRGVEALFGNRVYVEEIATEGSAYKSLVDRNIDFADLVSCMMPVRYRGKLRKNNLAKNLILRPGGCGQCYKCAIDYFYLVELGAMTGSPESDKHYISVLFKQWDHMFEVRPNTVRNMFDSLMCTKTVNVPNMLKRFESQGVNIDEEV